MKKEVRIIVVVVVVVVVIVVSTVSFLRKFSVGGKEENRSIAFFANIFVLERFVKNFNHCFFVSFSRTCPICRHPLYSQSRE